MASESSTPPILMQLPAEWFHGSPLRLEVLSAGSTVTPVVALARAFSHKPTRVGFSIQEAGTPRITVIEHNGIRHGYLYRVLVADPATDLRQHPTSAFAPGEEMLTMRDLPLEFLGELPITEACFHEIVEDPLPH